MKSMNFFSTKVAVISMLAFVGMFSTAFGTTIYHENFDQIIADGSWNVTQYVFGYNGTSDNALSVYEGPNWGYPIGSSFPDGALYGGYQNMYSAGGINVFINKNSLGTYQANTEYTLSAYLAVPASGANWSLSLTKGDVVTNGAQYPSLISLGTDIVAMTNQDITLSSSAWTLVTVTKMIGASDPLIGTPIGVQLLSSHSGTGGLQQLFSDGITLDATAVPEPATMIVLGIGSLFLRRRRIA